MTPVPVQPLDQSRVGNLPRTSNWQTTLSTWLKGFRPAPLTVDFRERFRAVAGAFLGIVLAAVLCRLYASSGTWLIAPLGASAVLVFALPASPLAQPWSVVGGNTLSAVMGVLCVRYIGDPAIAGGVAVAVAIAAMFTLRCLHPPGGAVALFAVLTHTSSFEFVLFPVLVNSMLLATAGILYNSATGRRYPHSQLVERPSVPAPGSRFSSADLDAVLKRYNQVLDVGRDDMENILHMAEMNAMERRMSDLRCRDIMTPEVVAVEYATDLQDAWALMRRHQIKALPVIDRQRRIIGIVTLADFMRHADLDLNHTMRERLQQLIRRTQTVHTTKPEVVGQIMSAKVRVASAERSVAELMPIFSEHGHHHIPIIDDENRLVGIITESDFVRAMYRSAGGEALDRRAARN